MRRLFEQYSLFDGLTTDAPPPAAGAAASSRAPAPPVRQRSRSYDRAILRYVAYYRLVTTHQILYRFFLMAGHGPGYGFRLVQRLVRQGFLEARRLDQGRGAVSRQTVRLTAKGWQTLGMAPPVDPKRAAIQDVEEYRLQLAEVMLVRESEGWTLLSEDRAWPRIREWALAPYKGRALNDQDRLVLRRLENLTGVKVGLSVLHHRGRGEIRFVLPVRRGRSFRRIIEKLPQTLGLFPPLVFEMVVAEPPLEQPCRDVLRRWSERLKIPAQAIVLPHFRTRPHPLQSTPADVYTPSHVPDPRTLI